MIRVLVVVPCYNHGRTLKAVLEGILNYTGSVLVVDDGSTDNSSDVALEKGVQLLTLYPNQGKGVAIRKGIEYGYKNGFTHILTIDADGQHPPVYIPEFIEKSIYNPEALIIGIRDYKGENIPWTSVIGGKISHKLTSWVSRSDIPDSTCGYRLYPIAPFLNYNFISTGYEFENEILIVARRLNLPILTIPVKVIYPKNRDSHYRLIRDSLSILKLIVYYGVLKR